MEKKTFANIILLVLIVFSINFSSANFVCGKVNDYENLSANWLNAQIWYNGNTSEVTNCTINPENKFCCDLDDLKSTKFVVGKQVTAEVFKEKEGYVSNRVTLVTTSDGYTLFPEINLTEAIKIINSSKKILINQSEVQITISLAEGYRNLNYTLYSGGNYSMVDVCADCSTINISIPLLSGENRIVLTSSGNHVVSKELVFYNLAYLNITRELTCENCPDNKVIPTNENVTMTVTITSSYPLSAEVTEFYPISFALLSDNYTEYSDSHNFFTKQINSSYLQYSYVIRAPSVIIPRKYIFKTQIEEFSRTDTVLVHKNWFSLYLANNFDESEWTPNKIFKIAPSQPLVIKNIDSSVVLVAVFPKNVTSTFYRVLQKEASSGGMSYKILSGLWDKDVESILVRLQSDLITNLSLYAPNKVNMNVSIDGDKKIYEGYINTREFIVK